ncbi:ROK family protein [Fulvivirgaceae bacterium PWU5]|uniref:ROK family protein n=1 Tax=Dawidia cretensis TaxID=2782350 RepID=A0AAP2GWD1_9BACT|nr:ROK family protein [Dawidia cretensis]MBT1712273.1 ROK family protein [Dawidia cretensis]
MAKKKQHPDPGAGNLWGIDLGGTKIEGVVLRSAQDPEVLFRDRVPTEADQGYEHILEQIHKLVEMMKAALGTVPTMIGFATPGTVDPRRGTMKNCNTVVMNGKPMAADIARVLGVPVRLANDANCFALAETRWGIVKQEYPDARIVFGVIIGTGVGGGVVIDGRSIAGLQGIGGEWGHNFLDDSGGPCYCGKSGCVERVISGPMLQQYYFKETGNNKPLKDIVALAESKVDPTAQKTMIRLVHFFGKAMSVIINILDPDVIVIGGGVGNIDLLYDRGRDAVKQNVFNDRLDTPIVRPMLGDSAGVFGAAFLVDDAV